jgi:tripartite-type tricarboxylate transporter receptor subunit TctC
MAIGRAFLLAAGLAVAGASWAQAYPTKPIRFIAPFAAGGALDTLTRTIAGRMQESWGQPVVVENRTGAGGNIGADLVAKAAPDGYTLVMGTIATHAINVSLYEKMPYDAVKDFAPVTIAASINNSLSVHPSVPAKNVAELIAYAKASPGRLTFGSAGSGTSQHLAGELFKTMAGVDMVHIPYKGGGPALADFFGGQVDVFVAIVSTVVPHVQGGKARALAVTGYKRAAALPDVPTVAESGFPGFESTNWYCLVGPPNLPRPIVDRWTREVVAVLNEPAIRQALVDRGIDPAPSSPAELAAYLKSESDKWAKVAKATGLQAH